MSIQSREQLRGTTREHVKRLTNTGADLGKKLKDYRATMKEIRKQSNRSKRAARVPLPEPPLDEYEMDLEEVYVSALADISYEDL